MSEELRKMVDDLHEKNKRLSEKLASEELRGKILVAVIGLVGIVLGCVLTIGGNNWLQDEGRIQEIKLKACQQNYKAEMAAVTSNNEFREIFSDSSLCEWQLCVIGKKKRDPRVEGLDPSPNIKVLVQFENGKWTVTDDGIAVPYDECRHFYTRGLKVKSVSRDTNTKTRFSYVRLGPVVPSSQNP